jgi:hypothetical protein
MWGKSDDLIRTWRRTIKWRYEDMHSWTWTHEDTNVNKGRYAAMNANIWRHVDEMLYDHAHWRSDMKCSIKEAKCSMKCSIKDAKCVMKRRNDERRSKMMTMLSEANCSLKQRKSSLKNRSSNWTITKPLWDTFNWFLRISGSTNQWYGGTD